VRKKLLSQSFTLRPFVREANTANKTTKHCHDLHQKRSPTTIIKIPPRKQNERSLQEIEMEEMRRKIQLQQKTFNA